MRCRAGRGVYSDQMGPTEGEYQDERSGIGDLGSKRGIPSSWSDNGEVNYFHQRIVRLSNLPSGGGGKPGRAVRRCRFSLGSACGLAPWRSDRPWDAAMPVVSREEEGPNWTAARSTQLEVRSCTECSRQAPERHGRQDGAFCEGISNDRQTDGGFECGL
ncbi:hypothetical protein CCHR01_02620 [Colletotrichum chrysophilum]|uniref:Uncharacterized protein n=1 Tax=Colletotrichum chrysophilum TaxID=1836956 RepID=A0AAD9AWK3_9PEZI|nr:hypothetical protein CCHR01_02620 [Colletotrichum chrysophilum]